VCGDEITVRAPRRKTGRLSGLFLQERRRARARLLCGCVRGKSSGACLFAPQAG